MQINFNFTKEQFINFNMHYYETSKVIQNSLLKQRLIGPIIYMIVPFVIAKKSDIPFIYWLVSFGIVSVLWFFFLPKYTKFRYKKTVEKLLNEKSEKIFGEKEFILGDEYILVKGEFQETKTEYDSIVDIMQTDEDLYLYTSSSSAIIFPKSAFKDETQKQEFLDKLYSKVSLPEKEQTKKGIFEMLDLK